MLNNQLIAKLSRLFGDFSPFASQLARRKICSSSSPPESPPPDSCCGSGCPECVFLQYARSLEDYLGKGSQQQVLDKIDELVDDPSLRAYLRIELEKRGEKISGSE